MFKKWIQQSRQDKGVAINCTVTNDLLKKLQMVNKDLEELSLDTVKMFYNDAAAAGYRI